GYTMYRTNWIAAAAMTAITATLHADVGPGECDGERPQFTADEYQSFGGGQIAAATQWRSNDSEGVLNVYDLTGQTTAPLGVDWPTSIYSHPEWVRSTMGQVFGVALDDRGNIYAAHTAIYFSDNIGSIGGQPGQVYIIDSVTGAPSVFATLPNNSDPVIAASPDGIAESYPGLGNLCFDVDKQMVYVSNFEDGRIYRIDASGTCLSTWDHATGIVSDCTPEAGDGEGAARLGERVWAVQSFNGRVYYSLWVEDSTTGSPGANEIWSVAYDAAGEFIAGTEQLEISVPELFNDYSNPVSDIAFGSAGQMMIAERTMQTDLTTGRFNTAPHQSRALEYICEEQGGGVWLPSPNAFSVGGGASNSADSAGGVDYSYAAAPDDRVWVTSDAMILGTQGVGPNVYGIQGLPQSGGNVASSILIDMDAEILFQDKSGLGSVEISCPRFVEDPCATISEESILCDLDPSGNYTLTFDLTNNSGQDVAHLLVLPQSGGANVVPSGLITLPSLLLDGDTTQVTITFNGGLPGDELCFILSLNTADFEECCSIEQCIVIPECDCAQVHDEFIECSSDGSGCFTYTFDVDNLTGDDIYYSFFAPLSPAGVSIDTGNIDPSRWDFPPMVSYGTETVTVTICGALPGEEVCFLLTMHTQNLEECCSIEVCITAPDCAQGIACPVDCTGDGVLNFLDISAFLNEFSLHDPRVDLNNDGSWNFLDVSQFLSLYAAGCP
ncbi:MAG: GC-type dockerin domain-anchored protein, partial [Phycisphaerales bacterium]|nr:GC-type dockerin domain-anchored protein [Phycisphaerales bacterium]